MFRQIHEKKAQSTLEYAVLIVIVIAAILTIQTYVKRGIQGRFKSAADDIGDQYTTTEGANYVKWVNTISNTTEKLQSGKQETLLRADEVTNTLTTIGTNADGEYWGN